MKIRQYIGITLLFGLSLCYACQKSHVYNGADSTIEDLYMDRGGPLQSLIDVPIGIGIDYESMTGNDNYRSTVAAEASNVTFGYNMKHGAIVQDNGSLNFSRADELLTISKNAGLEVFGHTLVWHENQNGNYLRSLTGDDANGGAENLLVNGSFEDGEGDDFTGWSKYNGAESFVETTEEEEVSFGNRALKVVVSQDNPNEQWRVQLASDPFPTTVGTQYRVSFWIKAAAVGGSMRLSTQPTAQYQGDQDVGTSWTQISWTIEASDPETQILFDMGLRANTYFVDDVMVVDASDGPPASNEEIAERVDEALKTFVQGTVNHFKNDVKAWDVVNEPVNESGVLRAGPYDADRDANDIFYWGQYLGRDFIKKAFTYAHESDPEALLFINDYNLETHPVKLDSLIAIVNWLKEENVPIHGIGTQMHSNIKTSYAQIDEMFQKLAATGLQIRVSELDVQLNPGSTKHGEISNSPTLLNLQAHMYKYIISSYLSHVPPAQRHGITVWGVTDADSWIVVHQGLNDAPLLFDNDFNKKPAYGAVVEALKGQ